MERPTNIIGKWIQPGLVYWPWVCNTIKLRSLLPFALAEGLICNKKLALAERELWLKPLCLEFHIRQLKQTAIKNDKPLINGPSSGVVPVPFRSITTYPHPM